MQVSYVDIENSLVGGRVCRRVSRVYERHIRPVGGYLKSPQDNPAAYHPNHVGHISMANDIVKSGVYKINAYPMTKVLNMIHCHIKIRNRLKV